MNTINKILGKDISSIIFKYLTINKNVIKSEYLKTVMYFNLADSPDTNFKPKSYKKDNKYISDNWKWNGGKWIYYYNPKEF
jgi:hypothetical protein